MVKKHGCVFGQLFPLGDGSQGGVPFGPHLGFKGLPPQSTLFCSIWTVPERLMIKVGYSCCILPVAHLTC